MAFDQKKYVSEYTKENYDRIEVLVPKGKKDLLKQTAAEWEIKDDKGRISVSQLFIRAVQKCYGIDLSKPDKEE